MKKNLKIDLWWGLVGGIVTVIVCFLFFGCTKPTNAPNDADATSPLEAGTIVINSTCVLLEGITQNQTVITICAIAEEIAQVVSFISSFLRHGQALDGGSCALVPTTTFCATKEEMGKAITMLIDKRRALLIKDSGAQ